MNIFVSDPCPIKSAQNLDDKRVIKMILESAQMLCTALHEHGHSHIAKYKATHKNHPCNIWARENQANYNWLYIHFIALSEEYTHRTGKIHKSYKDCSVDLAKGMTLLRAGELTPFANCAARKDMDIDYKHLPDVHEAYRLYLIDRWANDKLTPKWTKRNRPF